MNKLKDGCILANMGHTYNEIDVASLKDLKREKIRPHVSHVIWPNGKAVVLLADVSGTTISPFPLCYSSLFPFPPPFYLYCLISHFLLKGTTC